MADTILTVKNLVKTFPVSSGFMGSSKGDVKAVNDVSFSISRGETLGVVGESGCGKTTLGRTILHLLEPTSGSVEFQGIDVGRLSAKELRALRRKMQIVFQDPFSSLNPRLSVGDSVKEGLIVHKLAQGQKAEQRVKDLFAEVGLNPDLTSRYPHEFSGGQRQRIGIARALAVEPEFIVLDEPVSALDVSVQAQVINLLQDLQRERGLTYFFVAHDLSVVEHIANRVAVMYLGKLVEMGPSEEVYSRPMMPYTEALLSAVPRIFGVSADLNNSHSRIVLQGDPPSPSNPPSGCVFNPRCHHPAKDVECTKVIPPLEQKAPGHFAACIKQPVVAVLPQ